MKRYFNFFTPSTDTSLGATLINCGHEIAESEKAHVDCWMRGSEEFYVWEYTISGYGVIKSPNDQQKLLPGTAFLAKIPSETSYYLPRGSNHWEVVYLTIKGEEANRLCRFIMKKYGNLFKLDENSPIIQKTWDIVQKGVNGELISPYEVSARTYDFLMTVLNELNQHSLQQTTRGLLDKITAWVALHIAEPIDIGSLAAEFGYSHRQFSRVFNDIAGTTAQEFIIQARLKMAELLLRDGANSIKEVAARTGFNDASYFCKVFREKYGVTPKRFCKP